MVSPLDSACLTGVSVNLLQATTQTVSQSDDWSVTASAVSNLSPLSGKDHAMFCWDVS